MRSTAALAIMRAPRPYSLGCRRMAIESNSLILVRASTGSLRVEAISGKQAAEYLGFVPNGSTQQTSTTTDTSATDCFRAGTCLETT